MDAQLAALSVTVGERLASGGWMLATAESCTGGWVAEVVTATAGSSAWFDRGFVTYSNAAKQDMLGVSGDTLMTHGAVSEAVVREMAAGALAHSMAGITLAISGIAGPGGATPTKPVGLVCLAWAIRNGPVTSISCHFDGDRESIRRQSVICALEGLIARCG